MTRQKRPQLVIAFATTAQALAAETLFTDLRLPGRMIPLPPQIAAGCGLAWKAEPDAESALLSALAQAGLSYDACRVLELYA